MSSGTNNDTSELNLNSITDPEVTTGFAIRFRAQFVQLGNPRNPAETITVELWDGGGAAIATTGPLTISRAGGFALYEATGLTVAGGTNFAALTFRVITGGVRAGDEQLDVSWLEFEAPDPPGLSPPTLSAPTATAIGTGSATLGATIDTGSAIEEWGTVWNTTGVSIIENPSGNTAPVTPPHTFTDDNRNLSTAGAGTRVYYRGYADNTTGGGGTGYSPEGSFYLEPLQASTVTITGVTDTGMTVNWVNDASSDGAIVVVKEGAAVDVGGDGDPTDGIVHTFDADFSLAPDLGSGNKVVYRGPANSAPISGLAGATTYHVAVYAYAGTVADSGNDQGINYQQDAPEQKFDTTSAPLPTLSSPTATTIDTGSAWLGATIDNDNGVSVTDYGTVWNTTGAPIIENALSAGNNPGSIPPAFPFSHNQTISATPGTQIFYRGYATNSGGTNYSPDGSFYLEPTQVPALSVGFENVGYTSMTITWTAGGGDGAIVVVKEGAAVDVGTNDPVDGNEYAAGTSVWNDGFHLGNNNYVVYRGPANSAFISGLTGDTTYHVAVYEYAGSGSGINYQQDSPAIGSQATTPTALGHNDAHGITNCDQCHAMHGGSIVPHDADQETVCKTCHNSTQMAQQSKWNVGMHEITVVETRTVDCGSCHEVHNGYDFNTVDTHTGGVTAENQSRIRWDTSKYVTGAVEPALFQVDKRPEHFAFSDNYAPIGPPFNGICQTCHTNTSLKWHSSGSTETYPHDHHKSGVIPDNPNCLACHSHAAGFPRPTCFSCHSAAQDNGDNLPVGGRRAVWGEFTNPGNSHHTVTAIDNDGTDCQVCHEDRPGSPYHMDGYVDLLNADSGTLITESTSGGFQKANLIETDINSLNTFCQSCHDSDGANGNLDPFGDGSAGPPEKSLHSNVNFASDRVEGEFTVGCIQCHEGHGSTNIKIIDDTSVLVNNSTGLASAGTTSGPVEFDQATGVNSGDELYESLSPDVLDTSDIDDLCVTCHITSPNAMVNHADGDHTGSVQGTDETDNNCMSCHPHGSSITEQKGFMPPAGGAATCDTCHATGGSGVGDTNKNNRRAIFGDDGDFTSTLTTGNMTSYHVNDGDGYETVTKWDCAACHAEVDPLTADVGSYHDNGTVDLRHADGLVTAYTDGSGVYVDWPTLTPAARDDFCLSCHDDDGATILSSRPSDTGDPAHATPLNPFYDQVTNAHELNGFDGSAAPHQRIRPTGQTGAGSPILILPTATTQCWARLIPALRS
jgi:hypothetical protein